MAPMTEPAPDATPAPPSHDRLRGRLFRKYLLLIISLVSVALLASGGIGLYFSYQENRAALASLQHQIAIGASSRIDQYVRQITQQLSYAALPQIDAGDVELRRIEFLKLLRQSPAVTDISQIDATGREQLAVSRLGMDVVASHKDRSQEPAFLNAKPGEPWYSPVYFRKETEPYMTVALRGGGDKGAVTVAEVNGAFRKAAQSGPLQGILGYSDEPLVSSDYQGDPRSSIIDGLSTLVIGGNMVKILAWYDNEWGFSNRLVDLAQFMARRER